MSKGVYNRNADYPDRSANWWIVYRANGERIREPGCGSNLRATERLREMRLKELERGTWKHPQLRRADAMTVAQWKDRHFAARYAAAEVAPAHTAEKNVHDDEKRVANYVLPEIGTMPMAAVRESHIKAAIAKVVRGGALAPRSVHHVYHAVYGLFESATKGDHPIIDRNPCTLTTKGIDGGLPKKRDKNPNARAAGTFTHGELRELFTDERNPIDRRTCYALLFFMGGRFGEGAGRRVRDYDKHAQPLGRIHCATQYDDRVLKGEAPPRDIPVHPFLAWILEQWLGWGFELIMGRAPKPDDWLVPSRTGRVRSLKHMEHKLEQDLERIGLRRRTPHNLRAAFISLAQEDGGTRDVLECITHKGNRDVWGGYTRHPWHVLCEHVARLRMELPESGRPSEGAGPHFWPHASGHTQQRIEIIRSFRRDGRDLKERPPFGTPRKLGDFEEALLVAYAKSRVDLDAGVPLSTSRVALELADDLRAAAEAILSGRVQQLQPEQRARLAGAVQAAAGATDEFAVRHEPVELPAGKSA